MRWTEPLMRVAVATAGMVAATAAVPATAVDRNQRALRKLAVLHVLTLAACAPGGNGSANRITVTNANASGAGSFVAAIEAANSDTSIHYIDFATAAHSIVLREPLTFSGAQQLSINARGAIVDARALPRSTTAFTATGGGDISIDSLTVSNAPDAGIKFMVPAAAAGTIHITLNVVRIANSGGHGLIVNDQAEYFQNPDSDNNAGSAASLRVIIVNSTFHRNGFNALDRDGVRLNEGGAGDLKVQIVATDVAGNGGDGVEIDERGQGSAIIDVQGTTFKDNGNYSSDDLDDGLDIDEYDDGDIAGSVTNSSAIRNFDQGFDFNENGAGDLRVDLTRVQATENRQAGIDYSEDDQVAGGGSVVVRLIAIVAQRNGRDGALGGVVVNEKGAGDLSLLADSIDLTENAAVGWHASQAKPGAGTITVTRMTTHNNRAAPMRTLGVTVKSD